MKHVRILSGPVPRTTTICMEDGTAIPGITKAVLTMDPGAGVNTLQLEVDAPTIMAAVLHPEVVTEVDKDLDAIGHAIAAPGGHTTIAAALQRLRACMETVKGKLLREGATSAPGPYLYVVMAQYMAIIHRTIDLEGGGHYSRDLYPIRALVVALDSQAPMESRVRDMQKALHRHMEYPGVAMAHAGTMMFNGKTLAAWYDEFKPKGNDPRFAQYLVQCVTLNVTSQDGVQVFPENGSAWVAVGHGFVNLQESPAEFGETPARAASKYRETHKPKAGIHEQVEDELAEVLAEGAP